MAEIATIARPYAEALFQASRSQAAQAAQWLDELAAVAAHEQLRQFADSPKSSPAQVFDLISGVLAKNNTSLPEMAQNFLRTVIDNGRLAAMPEIARQFRVLKNAQQGAFDAVVYSAFELDGAALADLSGVLETRFGRKLNLQVELQPDLIGGVRVVVGDEVLDTSIKARLEQMKIALTA
jgi:F-type H+-transporting ATPase subunit delta